MPWLSLGFDDERTDVLSTICDVEGIPQLSIFDANGELVSSNGCAFVSNDKEGNEFPWRPKPFDCIDLASNEDLTGETCVIGVFADAAADKQFLETAANEHHAAFKRGEKDEIKFFFTHGITDRLQLETFKVTPPAILALSLPKYISVPASPDKLNELLENIQNNSVKWNSLQ